MAVSKVLSEALSFVPQGYLFGLTMSTAGSSAAFTMAAGIACDSTGLRMMKLANSLVKNSTAWALGSAGSLDTGAVAASTWYHVFLIQRVDTGVVDILTSLSATAPTMPANYTLFRRVGAMKTNGSSNWTNFFQNGDTFLWSDMPALDFSGASGTTANAVTVATPPGVRCEVIGNIQSSPSTNNLQVLVSSMDVADTAPGAGVSPLATFGDNPAASNGVSASYRCWTNASAQVRMRAANTVTIQMQTVGWVDTRGKLS